MSTLITTVQAQVFDPATIPAGSCIRITKKQNQNGNMVSMAPYFGIVISCSKTALTHSRITDSCHVTSDQIRVEDVTNGLAVIEIIPLVDPPVPAVNPSPVTP